MVVGFTKHRYRFGLSTIVRIDNPFKESGRDYGFPAVFEGGKFLTFQWIRYLGYMYIGKLLNKDGII